MIKKETYRDILSDWSRNKTGICIPKFEDRRGHPPVFPKSIVQEILSTPDNIKKGLKFFLNKYKTDVYYFQTLDKGVIIDIDSPEDYSNVLNGKYA